MSLFAELRRRNVIRMAGLYLVGAWLLVQIAETLLPIFHTPHWVLQALVVLLALGFLPALVFSWVFELTPDGIKRDSQVPADASIAAETGKRMEKLILAGMALVVLVVAADRFWPAAATGPEQAGGATAAASAGDPEPSTAAAPVLAIPAKSIAVLAFADMSPGRDQEYFSDGVAEEILNALAKVKDLRVAGRTSSFHFKGRNEDLRTIGETLGVAHILEGSVRKQGDKVRVTAQLIRSADGFHLWSETYDGELSDVFELQESIARNITDELKVVLQGGQGDRLVNAGTANTEAYALYLQATAIFNRREGPRFAEALAMLDQALTLDPAFARAWSRKATLFAVSADYQTAVDSRQIRAAGEAAAKRAIELDASLAEPHAALALAYVNQRRYREYRAAMARAVAIDPDDITVNFWGGVSLLNMGYRAQAIQAFDKALAIDPLLPNALFWRARLHIAQGDFETARPQLQRASDSGHGFVGLVSSRLALHAGEPAEATEQLAQSMNYFARDLPDGAKDVFARAIFGDADAKTEALRYIDDYLAGEPPIVAGLVPFVLIRMGDTQRGFDLTQDRPTSSDSVVLSEVFSGTEPHALTAPGFPAFVRHLGLASYWDEFGPPENCSKAGNGDYTCR